MAVTVVFLVRAPDPRPKEEGKSPFSRVLRRKDFWIIATLWSFAGGRRARTLQLDSPLPGQRERPLDRSGQLDFRAFPSRRLGSHFSCRLLIDRLRVKKVLAPLAAGLRFFHHRDCPGGFLSSSGRHACFSGNLHACLFSCRPGKHFKAHHLRRSKRLCGSDCGHRVVFGTGIAPTLLGTVADLWSFQAGMLVAGSAHHRVCLLA